MLKKGGVAMKKSNWNWTKTREQMGAKELAAALCQMKIEQSKLGFKNSTPNLAKIACDAKIEAELEKNEKLCLIINEDDEIWFEYAKDVQYPKAEF